MSKFKIRDKKTGEWVCYGQTSDQLETDDRQTAQDLVDELQDYGIDGEVVEVDAP